LAEDSSALGPDAAISVDTQQFFDPGAADAPDAAVSIEAQQFLDSGAADSPDAAISPDAGQFPDTIAPDSRASDTADTGLECSANPARRPDIPSRQTVRFHFVSSSSDYLVTSGIECGAFVIDRLDGDGGVQALLLGMRAQCICECPVPPTPSVGSATALNQSAASVLSWNARELQPYQVCVECSARPPGAPSETHTFTSAAPVGPGPYRATFAVMNTLPATCSGQSADMRCGSQYGGYPSASNSWLCPDASRTLSVEFDLPASGDLDVTVVDTQTTNDASTGDVPIERANDVASPDAARDDKGIACGTTVCTPGQVCVIDDPCCYPVPNPNGGQPAPCPTYACKDIPAGCGEYPDCSCLGVCNGRCPEIMNGTVECMCQ
jgi:hypothetical protein